MPQTNVYQAIVAPLLPRLRDAMTRLKADDDSLSLYFFCMNLCYAIILFKHYLTEEDDRYLDTLDVTIKYLPDLDLEYPGGVKPRNKQESESMRATSFSCSTIPINWEQGQWSTYATGNNVFIQYNMDENHPNIRGTIYGNAAICQESSWSGQSTTPPKRHWFEFNFRTHNYDGQASHTPVIARYKWIPNPFPVNPAANPPPPPGFHHGIGMYFGNSGSDIPNNAYWCNNPPYVGQSSSYNTRIEAWWLPNSPNGQFASGPAYNDTCGLKLSDDIAYKVFLDGSTNANNSVQTVRYKVNRWVNYGSTQNPNWVDEPHTNYVDKAGPLPNFDEEAKGVFIVSTLPSSIPPGHRDWTVDIQSLNTWWTN